MRQWFKNKLLNLKLLWFSLFHGMKSADELISGNKTEHLGDGLNVNKIMEVDNVFNDLLKGEVTERVVETRHSLYAVHQHSIDMEKKEKRLKKNEINEAFLPRHCLLIEGEYYPVKLIQENKSWVNENSNDINEPSQYLLNVERDFLPRLKIEDITTKISVKEYNDEYDEIDFYCRSIVRKFHDKDNFYISELKKIFFANESTIEFLKKTSDLLIFNTLSFHTEKPFGVDEGVLIKYDNFIFQEILEFDGHYILRFIAKPVGEVEKLIDKYKSDTMTEKYEKKQVRVDAPAYELASWGTIDKQQEMNIEETNEALNLLKNLKTETLSIKKETKNS